MVTSLKIIPVIDILNGIAVNALRGKRSEYHPLKSKICDSTNPMKVALSFRNYGFHEIYIADLDAIMNKGSNCFIFEKISAMPQVELLIDAGISDLKNAQNLLKAKSHKIIIGTESLLGLGFVKDAVELFGNNRVIVSIDLKNGKILSKSKDVSSLNINQLICKLQEVGLNQIIILDLSRVGSNEGVDIALLKRVLRCFKGKVFVGGGIRSVDEVLEIEKLGVEGVLLASALHSGSILIDSLHKANLI